MKRIRTIRDLSPRPEGFVIFRPDASEDLAFYCETKKNKTTRTTYWTDKPDRAKVYKSRGTAKKMLDKLKERGAGNVIIKDLEEYKVEAFYFCTWTKEVTTEKVFHYEINSDTSNFNTRLEALEAEHLALKKERAEIGLELVEKDKEINKVSQLIGNIKKSVQDEQS